MAQTQIGVVFGSISGIVSQVIVPDNDSELENWPVPDGSSLQTIPIASLPTDTAGRVLFDPASVAGFLTLSAQPSGPTLGAKGSLGGSISAPLYPSRCCVVVNGVVTAVIAGDPNIQNIPGATIVQSDTAGIGVAYNGTSFG